MTLLEAVIYGNASEPLVDDVAGAVVGGREQVGINAESERRVGVAEVLG